jgi:hypothetical protein
MQQFGCEKFSSRASIMNDSICADDKRVLTCVPRRFVAAV